MKSFEIREKFLQYFENKGHKRVKSSSLIPQDDPTLLFTNAGMNQFKALFLGAEKRDYTRAVSCQKCLRISGKHNDLENVGATPRHHTFFEMLGNFSFGDYFKREAIQYGWEFITEVVGLDKERLWITVYKEDQEAVKLWQEIAKIPLERIVPLGEKDNFWAMGDTGPCGPCSEIHYFLEPNINAQSRERLIADDGSFLEVWNLVFMEFNRDENKKLHPLPKPSIDTGMGLERITAVCQKVASNYDTDLLRPIISVCEKASGKTYKGIFKGEKEQLKVDTAMRVISDHARAVSFLIADGIVPESEGRGYVLRRLIRRAVRHSLVLEYKGALLQLACKEVIKLMKEYYPELKEHSDIILNITEAEEKKFLETIEEGITILNKEIKNLPKGGVLSGKTAFLLHDTYGFPLDLTEDILKEHSIKVNKKEFEEEMEKQRRRSRQDRESKGQIFTAKQINSPPTAFLGYDTTEEEGKVTALWRTDKDLDADLKKGSEVVLVFNQTPFYAESGGQIGDTGKISFFNGEVVFQVLDTQKTPQGHYLHYCVLESCPLNSGKIKLKQLENQLAKLVVDKERRQKIMLNHSATHLLHAALRNILGSHVHQAGSLVSDQGLRFDYTHFQPLSDSAIKEIEEFINSEIRNNYEVVISYTKLEEAKKKGAMALFGEKYGDIVRVVQIGPHSLELCGGTHVKQSGDIGFVVVTSEGGIASGVRRIECKSGQGALQELFAKREMLKEASKKVGAVSEKALLKRLEKVIEEQKKLEQKLQRYQQQLAQTKEEELAKNIIKSKSGIKIVSSQVDNAGISVLRTMVDKVRQNIGSGVVALAGREESNGKSFLVVGVTSDLVSKINAKTIAAQAAKFGGGQGGGREDFAQAGGIKPEKVEAVLKKVIELVP